MVQRYPPVTQASPGDYPSGSALFQRLKAILGLTYGGNPSFLAPSRFFRTVPVTQGYPDGGFPSFLAPSQFLSTVPVKQGYPGGILMRAFLVSWRRPSFLALSQ